MRDMSAAYPRLAQRDSASPSLVGLWTSCYPAGLTAEAATMRNVEHVRNWVQIVQGVFVILGVIFAVWQFEFQIADRAQKRVAETDQRLRELERDPVHSAVLYLTEAGQASASINGGEFIRRTEPLRTYFAAMTRCIALETCDRAITQDGLCQLVATYVRIATQIPWDKIETIS